MLDRPPFTLGGRNEPYDLHYAIFVADRNYYLESAPFEAIRKLL